jgi:dTDP-4-amino-4,6-dideoxygalactose transaminase
MRALESLEADRSRRLLSGTTEIGPARNSLFQQQPSLGAQSALRIPLRCRIRADSVVVTIPFNRAVLAGKELEYIREAIEGGELAGDGAFTRRCQDWLADFIGARAALLTHSCTAALEMAAILIGIEPGDEVVMPSYTFASTATAVVLRGGTPVFVDIRPDTLNIDEELVEAAITPRTKAIFPVHYAGVPAEMDRINELAELHKLYVVEDAAQALGSKYKERYAGSIGHLAAFSFHQTKNIVSGEGGALAVNDPSLLERAEIIWEKGTNRKRFFRGQIDTYTWVDLGSSFLPSELVAAFLFGQLEQIEAIQRDRTATWLSYDTALRQFHNRGLRTPVVPSTCEANCHLYYILMPNLELRDRLIARMKVDGIVVPFHYVPLHSAPAGLRFGRPSGQLVHTEDLSARLVRLPLYPQMGGANHRVLDRLLLHLDQLL